MKTEPNDPAQAQNFYRLMSKTIKNGECLEFTGGISSTGYGVFWMSGKNVNAHKASYILHNGTDLNGLFVLHTCDNKKCINPEHLYLGDRFQNAKDACNRGRMATGLRHGVHTKQRKMSGEDNPFSKLSNEECLQIKKMCADGGNKIEIAKNKGLNLSTVYRAIHRADALIEALNK